MADSSVRQTPPLSEEGAKEVAREASQPPADTPERRRMFELVKKLEDFLKKHM